MDSKTTGKVFDLFSGRRLDTIEQDYKRNDQTVEHVGKYVGKLPKYETEAVRELVDQLTRKKVQIDTLLNEFNEMHNGYALLLAGVLAFLDVDVESFDPEKTDAYVDKNGNVWLVNEDEKENFYKTIGESPLL